MNAPNERRAADREFESELASLASQMATAVAPFSPAQTEAAEDIVATSPLRAILQEMEAFLCRCESLEALPLVLLMGQITTVAQLRAEFSAYAELVGPEGAPAHSHLLSVARLIARAEAAEKIGR